MARGGKSSAGGRSPVSILLITSCETVALTARSFWDRPARIRQKRSSAPNTPAGVPARSASFGIFGEGGAGPAISGHPGRSRFQR